MSLSPPLAAALSLATVAAFALPGARIEPAVGADDPPVLEAGPALPGARAEILAVNYSSLQAAFDALPAEGGVVRLPPGEFHLEKPLRLERGDVRIVGAGPATHIINDNQSGEPALLLSHPDGAQVKNADKLWRVELTDFRVTGNPASGPGVLAVRINEIYLHGLTVSEHGDDGVRLDNCYEDPRVADCLITYNKAAGLNLIGCHDIVVSANHFEENRDAVLCTDGFNLCMTGNNLDDHLGRGVVIENTYGSVLSGNMIEECAAAAVVLDRDCYGITVSANVIAHNGAGVDLIDAHGCAVSANTFTIMQGDALRIGENSGRITVAANNFSDSHIGDGQVKRLPNDRIAGGMVATSPKELVVVGNLFSGLSAPAIDLRGAAPQDVVMEGNAIFDPPADADAADATE
ncbi:right-handed parallel beta-helix repeat-containing protein [Alienimonas californiensis]|uniref:right-handed parallel beta-helix repeat-containing protein n=1 Tax=Alienimonas californiensis TaxID=2527989 RepID=UPI0011A621C6|nr:right-handed parallel beta-helix repeat-containing protein [Alienimonas californiensis]